jgi:hypothetical protein
MKGNLHPYIGPINDDNACPVPLEMELKIANVPNQPDLSSGGIASDIIEYPTGKTHPNPAPLSILLKINIS